MLYSKLFGKTKKAVSSQFESKSHGLLTKAGFIDQVGAGIFSFLPLGKKVMSKIENIIREEINNTGGQEIQMPILHPIELWEKTGRSNIDILFTTDNKSGNKFAIAPTHEETVTPLAKKFIKSYRDLPLALYHITQKFRNEARPKSGILRGREFGMKDLYSFHADRKDFENYYKKVIEAYLKIFSRCGLSEIKITEASGGSFTEKFSHEFNVITPAGEVDLIYCSKCTFTQNEEIFRANESKVCPKCQSALKQDRAIEIGNIFDLGIKFCEHFDFKYVKQNGQSDYPIMGCYGIGTSRLLGTIVEVCNDEKGIIWPKSVAPYQVHLVGLDLKDEEINSKVHKVYKVLKENNIEILFDDREEVTAGEKFSDTDLIGIPVRLVISKRTGDKVEYKKRDEKKTKLLSLEEIISKFL